MLYDHEIGQTSTIGMKKPLNLQTFNPKHSAHREKDRFQTTKLACPNKIYEITNTVTTSSKTDRNQKNYIFNMKTRKT